jgi:hypothetical protein
MARMVPDIDPQMIGNHGERLFYEAARRLPDEYAVFYSFKFALGGAGQEPLGAPDVGEIDFVVIHPALGYVTIEVKQGEISYCDGTWSWFKDGRHSPLRKDPAVQAQNAMYAILERYKKASSTDTFPLKIRYAVAFPECARIVGVLPPHLDPVGVLLAGDLEVLDSRLLAVFGTKSARPQPKAVELLAAKVLAPSFRALSGVEEQIQLFEARAKRLLTDEQERILEETELDIRKVFFGAAGSGKTFLAMEKARRLAAVGRKVYLTCFNKNLADYMRRNLPDAVTVGNFHDYLMGVLRQAGRPCREPEDDAAKRRFYADHLPSEAFEYYASAPEAVRFDSIVVDEGQDFSESWFVCLESMLRRQDGEFYVFADPNQNLFGVQDDYLKRMPVSRHRLTRNLRNTASISEWVSSFVTEGKLRPVLEGGIPVVYHPWDNPAEEKRLIEAEAGRLVGQGIRLHRIIILSPDRLEKSCLAGATCLRSWSLSDFRSGPPNSLRFATIRSFKGLEADIAFLIGLKEGKPVCSTADIYVGGSRARYMLHVFHHRTHPPQGLTEVMKPVRQHG